MNDNQLNQILQAVGARPLHSRATDPEGNQVKGIKRDHHMKKAKNELGGVHWDSILNEAHDRIEQAELEARKRMNWTSEYHEHILVEITSFLAWAGEQGLYGEADAEPFDLKDVENQLARRESGEDIPMTPALLLSDYVTSMRTLSEEIKAVLSTLVKRLQSVREDHNYQKESDHWIIQEARKLRLLTQEEDDELSALLASKQRLVAYYQGKADLFRVGNSPVADALAFALLWRNVMVKQTAVVVREDERRFQEALDAFREEFRIEPTQNPALLSLLRQRTPKQQYKQLASVLTLFPKGAAQFLDITENGRVTTYKKPSQAIVGMFQHADMNESFRQQAKSWEGKSILLHDGQVIGTGFQYATEDLRRGVAPADPRTAMVRHGVDPQVVEAVCQNKFKKGDHVWLGGYYQARVLFAETHTAKGEPFQRGVKLWMDKVERLPDAVVRQLEELERPRYLVQGN